MPEHGLMRFREIAVPSKRRLIALITSLLLAGGLGYYLKSTPPAYLESATVVFVAPKSTASPPNPYSAFGPSLITTGDVIATTLSGPQYQGRVRAAGGTANYTIALVNLYNLEFPDYGEPFATLTSESQNPVAVQNTFKIVARSLMQLLATRQAQAGVPSRYRISAVVVGDTGPIVQPGSRKRVYAGVVLLAIIIGFMVSSFLDRHWARLAALVPSRWKIRRSSNIPDHATTARR
jgi:hypothetical protein